MSTKAIEPLLRDATIKAINKVAKKLTAAELDTDTKMARLVEHWNDMDSDDKEYAVGIAIATITTAVSAIVALRSKSKSPLKKAGKKLVKAVVKKGK
jgi:hypothetical protein